MKKILKQLRMTSLKKIYSKEKAQSKQQIKCSTLMHLKKQETAINNFNKNRRKAKEEVKIADIIKVPKKRKRQKDKAALIAAKKISKKYKNIRFR